MYVTCTCSAGLFLVWECYSFVERGQRRDHRNLDVYGNVRFSARDSMKSTVRHEELVQRICILKGDHEDLRS